MTITQRILLAVLTSCASAQPFVHSITEPGDQYEAANDLAVLTSQDIAFVGRFRRDVKLPGQDGWIVVHRPNGIPFLSWVIEDPDKEGNPLVATFEDPVDKNLIVLEGGLISSFPNDVADLVLFKIDPFSGALSYQWRYPGYDSGIPIGMERDGDTGLVAASLLNSPGITQATLLRFRNADGLPIFHNRYLPLDEQIFSTAFYDIAISPESGDIFAVGIAKIDSDQFSVFAKILIARFDPAGNPIWFSLYEPVVQGTNTTNAFGYSIAINSENNPFVVSTVSSSLTSSLVVPLVVDGNTGAPIVSSSLQIENHSVVSAASSLEQLPNGDMLTGGAWTDPMFFSASASLWSFDELTAQLQWDYTREDQFGRTSTVMPDPNGGLLFAGYGIPTTAPVGFEDALLTRTGNNGNGLCERVTEFRSPEVSFIRVPFQVKPIALQEPNNAGIEAIAGTPVLTVNCEVCRPDLNMDGSLDFFDISFLLMNMVDYNGDTVFDFFDISAYLMDFSAGCP